jgi:hypothetical protein
MGSHQLPAEDTAVPENGGEGVSALIGPTDDPADEEPRSRVDQILQWVARVLVALSAVRRLSWWH